MKQKSYFILLMLLLSPMMIWAGTMGKIKGKVVDLQSGEPLVGANVVIPGTSFGAATDINGDYVINNLEAGVYELKATFIGYQAVTISNVRVFSDLFTETNISLPPQGITVSNVEITALRPLVNKSSTNAVRITTSDDIDALPVRGINNIVSLTAGVVLKDNQIFIRGGRLDEVGFYLEGVSITNPLLGGRSVTIVQDAVEEIQVQAGGYTAEFGGANSGIIRQQLKTGPKTFKASVEYSTDNISFKSRNNIFDGKKTLGAYTYGYNEMTATLGGPLFDERFRFFGLFNYNYMRDNDPQPYPGINLGKVTDPVTKQQMELNYPAGPVYKNSNETYTYTGTLTMDLKPFIIRLAGTMSNIQNYNAFNTHRVAGNLANLMNSARIEEQNQTNGSGSLKLTHILSPEIFYEINAGYYRRQDKSWDPYLKDNFIGYGDSLENARVGFTGFSSRYTRPRLVTIYDFDFNGYGDVLAGYLKRRSENVTLTGALSILKGKTHSVKIGGEFNRYTIRNYSFGNENVFTLAKLLADNEALPDGHPLKRTREQVFIGQGVNNYGYDVFGNEYDGGGIYAPKHPTFAAVYVQDKMEYKDLILNLGVRYDYINVDNKDLIDPAKPELSFDYNTGEIFESGLVDVPSFSALSPRIGLSFPVTDKTVFHAQYGKFVQQTRLSDMYQGLTMTSDNLRGGMFISYPVGFNIKPTRTTQYEIGFTQQVGDIASFDITGYYKDVKDQVVYDLQNTDSNSPFKGYSILKNGDFATTKGLELSFNLRRYERIAVNASVSFQDARGTGSFPNSNRGIVGAPIDGMTIFRPQYVSPLEFNNAFSGNVNVDYRFGRNDGPWLLQESGVSLLMKFNSGHPYTAGIGAADLEGNARDRRPTEPLNASTTPSVFQLDLKLDKTLRLYDKLSANFYVFVINVFDRRNVENVFLRTGSTTDDGYLSDPQMSGSRSLDPQYVAMYQAINIDYYEQFQNAIGPITVPFFYGPPRQIRIGVRLEY